MAAWACRLACGTCVRSRWLVRACSVASNCLWACCRRGPMASRVALAQLMEHMEKVRHTQALEPLFRELDQGLGPVTAQVLDWTPAPRALSRASTNAFHVV